MIVDMRHTEGPIVNQLGVNGVNLSYQEQGQGAPVVFVHGAASDFRVWEYQRAALAKHFRFIAPTQRYFGTAPWTDSGTRFSLSVHANDLAVFIRELDVGPVHVVGWSYGAAVALILAVHRPDLVKSVFIFDPGLTTFVTDLLDLQAMIDDGKTMFARAKAASKAGDDAEAVRALFEDANDQPGTFENLPPAMRAAFLDNARTMPLLFNAPPPPAITAEQLGQIRIPVSIAKGELSRTFYRVPADTASRCVPQPHSIIVPGARHFAPVQHPSEFNKAVLAFLKSIS